ncbi:MAG: hypothetical protein KDD47_11415 [Acidobacteria bacterium]|nr:hypothetical protein [Acidobacteriota bacterium]
MKNLSVTSLPLLALLLLAAGPEPPPSGAPVSVYAELDGSWEGEFVGYDTAGEEVYRIRVRQTYRTVDAETQVVEIADTMPDGTVITGTGANTARRLPDGGLELLCRVEKSNGEKVVHRGRLGLAPDGGPQLVWSSREGERFETFRETVRGHGDEAVYSIDGVGRYGESVVVMAGRYRRAGLPDETAPPSAGQPAPSPAERP